MSSYKPNATCLEVEKSKKYLIFLSERIGSFWYLLGILLDYELRNELSNIENDEKTVQAKALSMLNAAKDRMFVSWYHVRNQLELIGENNLIREVQEKFFVLESATGPKQTISMGQFVNKLSLGIGGKWNKFADYLDINVDTAHNTKLQDKALNVIFTLIKREGKEEFPWGKVKEALLEMNERQLIVDLQEEYDDLLPKNDEKKATDSIGSKVKPCVQDVAEVKESTKITSNTNKFTDQSIHLDKFVVCETYQMERKESGRCIIFNNRFEDDDEPRHGTDKDAESLTTAFTKLCFDVQVFPSLNAEEMKKQLKKEAEDEKNANRDCFVTVILSHGDTGVVFGNDHEPVKVQEITDYFNGDNCKSLATKPKLFFIQACRGVKKDKFVKYPKTDSFNQKPTLNVHADIFVFMATCEGFVAYRSEEGSWFIQELCKTFGSYADTLTLQQLVLLVNRIFGHGSKYQQKINDLFSSELFTQMPNVQHSLTKNFKFKIKF